MFEESPKAVETNKPSCGFDIEFGLLSPLINVKFTLQYLQS